MRQTTKFITAAILSWAMPADKYSHNVPSANLIGGTLTG
jgi:hypothetical protein